MLRRAFERGEIRLHYQPVIGLREARITGAEALLRWPEPDVGWIPPAVFVPIAEETGLMMRIGDWVLHEACRQLRSWIDDGLSPLLMAVNLADVLRKRAQMKLKIRAMSSESKASAYIVGSLPFIVFGMIWFINQGYMSGFLTDQRLMVAGIGGLIWMSIGAFIMAKMVSFEI